MFSLRFCFLDLIKKQHKKPLQNFEFHKIKWRCDFMGNFVKTTILVRKIFF